MTKSGKGSGWERDLCRKLSLWWTQSLKLPRDDVFWRTSNSGGRATTRSKKGKRTTNHYGDICAVDPIGQPLIDLLVIEAKRGYNRCTIADLLDKSEGAAIQTYEGWFTKAQSDCQASGSLSWILIHKRDRREPLVFMPRVVSDYLNMRVDEELGWVIASFDVKLPDTEWEASPMLIDCVPFDVWSLEVDPKQFQNKGNKY